MNASHIPDVRRSAGGRGRPGRRGPVLALLLLLAAGVLLLAAPGVIAAPPGPAMSLAQLGVALQSGPLTGHMLTTMIGTTPESIPLEVQSLVVYSDGTLILFEASGPVIDKVGGIAAGMSGSPVYVNVGGVDYLVGAVSYGDIFTRGGTGLATPIEYMTAIQNTYPVAATSLTSAASTAAPAPGSYALSSPVRTAGGVVGDVTIARSAAAGQQLVATADQPVMVPLGIIEIGGAKPGSKAYERVAAKFAKTGMLVVPASGNGLWAGAPTPNLQAGSPCGVLFSQGAVWVGAAGTVTYVDGSTALLFGHPFAQLGPMESLLTGGYVEGTWPSNYEPYKMIEPRDVKGTCVQDRTWGVEAHIGGAATLFPVHTTLSFGGRTLDDTSAAEEWLFTSQQYASLPADIAISLAYQFIDQSFLAGSATTTTTVKVSDTTGSYTVKLDNLWSDPYDVPFYVGMDSGIVLETLAANPDGTLAPKVDSVTVNAALSTTQRSARIENVELPGGLKVGANNVVISYYPYGSSTLKTLTTTLTVPTGTSLSGELSVTPGSWTSQDEFVFITGAGTSAQGSSARGAAPQTLAELVADLNAMPHNSDLVVSYSAGGDSPFGDTSSDDISVTVPTDYVFSDVYSAPITYVKLAASNRTVDYGAPAMVAGFVSASKDVPVQIYRLDADMSEPVLIDTVTAHVNNEGTADFVTLVPSMRKSATIIAVATAGDGSLAGRAQVKVAVRAQVRLSGGAALSIKVKPAASGRAKVERKVGDRWVAFRTVTIRGGAGKLKLPAGTYTLRARFLGSKICAAGTSRPFTVTVK